MPFTLTAWKQDSPATNPIVSTALAAHDVAIAWIVSDNTGTAVTWPSGFTELANGQCFVDSQYVALAIKPDCSGSESALTITTSSACVAGVLGIAGADNAAQPDVTTPASTVLAASTASPWSLAANSITPATAGALLVAFMGSDMVTNPGASSVSHAFADTGALTWTTRVNHDSGGFIRGAVGTAVQPAAATTTVTGTGTLAANNAGANMIVLAIKPAAGVSPPALMGQIIL